MEITNTNVLRESLTKLAATPNMRPFLFRTRFERNMIRIKAYAKETHQSELYDLATNSLNKIRAIVDKSNTTVDGELRSHALLLGDIQKILSYI